MSSVEIPARYLSPSQIALLLNVHDNTVNRWCRTGVTFWTEKSPPVIRTPGGWRILESDLFAWLDAVKADRAGQPVDSRRTPASPAQRVQAMESRLAAAGF